MSLSETLQKINLHETSFYDLSNRKDKCFLRSFNRLASDCWSENQDISISIHLRTIRFSRNLKRWNQIQDLRSFRKTRKQVWEPQVMNGKIRIQSTSRFQIICLEAPSWSNWWPKWEIRFCRIVKLHIFCLWIKDLIQLLPNSIKWK